MDLLYSRASYNDTHIQIYRTIKKRVRGVIKIGDKEAYELGQQDRTLRIAKENLTAQIETLTNDLAIVDKELEKVVAKVKKLKL